MLLATEWCISVVLFIYILQGGSAFRACGILKTKVTCTQMEAINSTFSWCCLLCDVKFCGKQFIVGFGDIFLKSFAETRLFVIWKH